MHFSHDDESPLLRNDNLKKKNCKRWRTNRPIPTLLGFATFAWLCILFSTSRRHEWQGTPLALPFQPLQTPEKNLLKSPNTNHNDLYFNPLGSTNVTVGDLSLAHIVFCIAGSAPLWHRRKEFVKLWWDTTEMRGFVWFDQAPPATDTSADSLPPVKLSGDISRFAYTNPRGNPSGVRIARILKETFRLGLPDVRWFVLGDDDTVFNAVNLVGVLSKYNAAEMRFVGSRSESHWANTHLSHEMAFGGGGIAISYGLAEVLSGMEDECLERYSELFGSDDRLHACITEIGIPLTREPGFHQWDVRGNAFGLLAGHPIAPFVSMHHLEAIDPVFPEHNSLEGLKLLAKALKTEPTGFLQRSICYDQKWRLSFSVSMGYVVQVFPRIILPRELDRTERTFKAWNRKDKAADFDIDTRSPYRSTCNKPFLFFLKAIHNGEGNTFVSTYKRDKVSDDQKRSAFCLPWDLPVDEIHEIEVVSRPMPREWHLVPRRQCCKFTEIRNKVLGIIVDPCEYRKSRP